MLLQALMELFVFVPIPVGAAGRDRRSLPAFASAHRALATLHPDQVESLDAQRSLSLAAVRDGPAKDAGIAVGEAAALAVLAERANDGSVNNPPYTPGTEPGQYRPTPPDFTPAFRPGLGQVNTFAIKSGAQFRICPPPALKSARYTGDYNDVKRVGDLVQQLPPAVPRRCRTLLCCQRRGAGLLSRGAAGEPGATQDVGAT